MEREHRRRFREIRRRRGQNVNLAPELRAAWQRCRELQPRLSRRGGRGACRGRPGRGQGLRQIRPSRPRRAGRAPEPRPSRLGEAHGGHALVPRVGPAGRCASPRSRPRSSPPGASTPSMPGSRRRRPTARASTSSGRGSTRPARWRWASTTRTSSPSSTDGGIDLSGRAVEIVMPPEALRILGKDFAVKHRLPRIALETRLIPDWEYPGYWLHQGQPRAVVRGPRRPPRRPPGGRPGAARGAPRRGDAPGIADPRSLADPGAPMYSARRWSVRESSAMSKQSFGQG